jgi:hypothetical protein
VIGSQGIDVEVDEPHIGTIRASHRGSYDDTRQSQQALIDSIIGFPGADRSAD